MCKIALLPAFLAATLAATATTRAHAAESYDNCKGFITSLPAVISTQGVWCMKGDLATTITTGTAITITANNVILDCNEFKLGGLGAGPSTLTNGISGTALNSTVRNCSLRGFRKGIVLVGDGLLVEDNRLDGMVETGIDVYGESVVVRRNRIIETGGVAPQAVGLSLGGSVEATDNLINEVYPVYGGDSFGILADLSVGSIARNQVRNVFAGYPGGTGTAIWTESASQSITTIEGNDVSTRFGGGQVGVRCNSSGAETFRNNVVTGFEVATAVDCDDDGGNVLN